MERLRTAVSEYCDECEGRIRPNTLKEYRRHLIKAPDIALADLTKKDVDLREPHAVNAWKVFMNWCIRNEFADRNPFMHIPVRYGKRERVLSDAEINAIWHYEHKPFTDIVKLLLLTGQRRNQIWKLRPEWIADTINFPDEFMKNGKPHAIPYGPLTKEYLDRAPFSFNGWSKAKARIDKHTGVTGWTIHDLRRTHATIQMRLGTPVHVTEAILAHTSGTISGVAAIYIRHNFIEEMRTALLRFEDHIASTVAH